MTDDLIYRLHKGAESRRRIKEGKPDRCADLLEEAANEIARLRREREEEREERSNIWLEGGEAAHRARGQD